ncbi:MAG: hypothetical protein COB30_002290 [Ectothiorhodospiraceae bacterium]|nr:hypothetical protein [Ectothiorhodospiraceae bacterium]
MTKSELAKHMGEFTKEHGAEEASKVLSRMLLALAHSMEADSFEFSDDGVGRVLVEPQCIQKHLIN